MPAFRKTLQVSIPERMDALLREAADRHEFTLAEYIRGSLVSALEADGFKAPPIGRRASDRRLEEIIALPESRGRRQLAVHLARLTSVPIEEAADLLRMAHIGTDLGGQVIAGCFSHRSIDHG